jgi:hypothetical protein
MGETSLKKIHPAIYTETYLHRHYPSVSLLLAYTAEYHAKPSQRVAQTHYDEGWCDMGSIGENDARWVYLECFKWYRMHLISVHPSCKFAEYEYFTTRLNLASGEVTEWFKVLVLKTSERVSVPWVRIPPSPPPTNQHSNQHQRLYHLNQYVMSIQLVLKTSRRASVSWVRIPPHPPPFRYNSLIILNIL